jgi:transforming growth factor-beta-induced protein
MRKLFVLMSLLAVLMLASVPTMAQESNTIVDIAAGNPDFSTLVTAVQAAGLVDTLQGEGPFTVFAPTNEAFAALGQDTINSVLANKELLTSILTYHVVAGKVMAADVVKLTSATTVEGSDIKISVKDGKVYLNDTIQVVTTDIEASNGVIHVIDGVLMPPAEAAAPAAEEMTHIRVAHFSSDTPAVDVYVNGELSAVQGLTFPNVTDWIELPAGSYNIAVAPAGTSIDSAAIGPAGFELPAGAWITVAAVGSLANKTLKPAVLVEDYAPANGQARVTVFHGIEDAPSVDVLAGGSKVISSLAFPGKLGSNDGLYSLDVPAGSYDFQVVPAGSTSPVVLDLPGTELSADTNYFVAAVGTLADPQVVVKATAIQPMVAAEPLPTIADIAIGNPDFSTLVAAVQAAGLVDTLNGPGPFTVFAPTNEAFAALGQDTINSVLADKELLTNILTYHVVAGDVQAADVVKLNSATTVEGTDIKISVKDGKVYLNDTIQVITTDIEASNGVIHVIDGVLLPPA